MSKDSTSKKEPTAPVKATLEQNVQAAVDKWYADNMHNTAVSRDTAVHNLIHGAKPALIKAVTDAVSQTTNQE